jgi:hypothetical protein
MSTQDQYPTDATDGQWHLLQRLLPKPRWQPGGEGETGSPPAAFGVRCSTECFM